MMTLRTLMVSTTCYLYLLSLYQAFEADESVQNEVLQTPSIDQQLNSLIQGTRDDIHIVFSTGCHSAQNFESELLLGSWARVQQPGRITRIISGCKNEEEKQLAMRTAIPNDDNRILFYFTDDFAVEYEGRSHGFYYFNKPFGTKQWIEDQFDHIYENVIVHLDPDMIILRPFLFHIEAEANKWAQYQHEHTHVNDLHDAYEGEVRDLWVREGHPVSQYYDIRTEWVDWKGFCDDRPSCKVPEKVAAEHYRIGPPYMMHKNDWLKFTAKWVEFSPKAYEYNHDILAEMYSCAIASAYFNL